jgi:hypothetical protein
MTKEEVEEKCFGLLRPILKKKRARALIDAIWTIEQMEDVKALRPLTRA